MNSPINPFTRGYHGFDIQRVATSSCSSLNVRRLRRSSMRSVAEPA